MDNKQKKQRQQTAEMAALHCRVAELEQTIARHQQEKQALEESADRFRALFEASPSAITAIQDGCFVFANPVAARMLGYSTPQEVIGLLAMDCIAPASRELSMERMRRLSSEKANPLAQLELLRKDGTTLMVESSMVPIKLDGKPAGMMIATDITERIRTEREKEILGAISHLFLASVSLTDVYAGLPRILAALLQFPMVTIELYDETNHEMVLVGSAGLELETTPVRTPIDQTLSGTAVSTGRAITQADSGPWLNNQSLDEWEIQTFLCVPIQASGKAIGAISFADRQAQTNITSSLDTLDAVAYRLYQEIERKQTADALRDNTKRLEILLEIDQAILAAESPVEIAQAALAGIRTIVPSRRASIVGYDFEAEEGIVLAAHLEGETRIGIGAHIDLSGMNSDNAPEEIKMVIVNDIAAQDVIPPSSQAMLDEGVHSYLTIPLWVQNELIGSLNIGADQVGAFAPEHVELAQQVANSLAIAIQNARLYERTHKEIAERRAAEAALRESERRYRTLIETMNDGLVTVDTQERITFANDRFCEMMGYSHHEIIGRHMASFHDQANQAIIRAQWDRRHQGDSAPYELTFIRSNGENLHTILSPRPLLDSEGHFTGSISVITDVTALKKAEQERNLLLNQIHEQAQQLQQIIHTVPEGVVLLDRQNQIIMANAMANKMLPTLAQQDGAGLTHLAGRPLSQLLTPRQTGLWHKLEQLEPVPQYFEVIARPIEYGSALEGQVLVIRDVTQEREIQQRVQQQERMAAVGQLAAGVAHDFNNIMAVILLYTQLLSRTLDCGPANRERLKTIVEQSHRATELINQILDFSRSSVLERKLINLESLLKEQVKLLRRTLPENIEIEFISGGDEYIVDADVTRIQQVVMNLAVNARDAMPDGGLLRLSLSRTKPDQVIQCVMCGQADPAVRIQLTVSDSGAGIAGEVIPYIFEPFFTTKEPGRGSGLGLAQVYGIVMQHEGHLSVTSTPQKGTSFSIYLPAVLPVEAAATPATPAAVFEGQGQTILVAEDEPAVRKALVNILEQLNFRPLEAENGHQARQLYEQRRQEIALVLTDLVMPGMGGLDLCRELVQMNPAVRVILLTGYPLEKDSNELVSTGIAGWLKKPVSLADFSQAIATALHRD